jgi:Tfp pilus assembly protein PilP
VAAPAVRHLHQGEANVISRLTTVAIQSLVLGLVLGGATLVSAAQQPAPAAPAPAAAPPGQAASAAPPPAAPAPQPPPAPVATPPGPPEPENYTYNSDGRRDPFTSLIGTGANVETRTPARGEGAAMLSVADISVRGIMQSRGALVAMVEGPSRKTYIVHQGDKLLDGMIKTITPQGLVLIQEVNDPLSLVKQREVSKLLRSLEGGK